MQARVCLICQRYKFKSKSQHKSKNNPTYLGVFDMSKIQIQKQITTELRELVNELRCV